MIWFLVRWLVTAIAVLVAAQIVKGVHCDNFKALAVAALVLGIVNAFLRPVLLLITLPFNILSFGILTLFINGFLFWLVGRIVKDFQVNDFWAGFWGALIVSIVSFCLNSLIGKKKRVTRPNTPRQSDHDVIDV